MPSYRITIDIDTPSNKAVVYARFSNLADKLFEDGGYYISIEDVEEDFDPPFEHQPDTWDGYNNYPGRPI